MIQTRTGRVKFNEGLQYFWQPNFLHFIGRTKHKSHMFIFGFFYFGFFFFSSARTASSFVVSVVSSKHSKHSFLMHPSTSLMATQRGLNQGELTACAPTPDDMILYCKAAEDGRSMGDCPFTHSVRMALHTKQLSCEPRPTSPINKPQWLSAPPFNGAIPALKHGGDCYTDSNKILHYLDFFFDPQDELFKPEGEDKSENKSENKGSSAPLSPSIISATSSFFPSAAAYLVNTDQSSEAGVLTNLQAELTKLEAVVTTSSNYFANTPKLSQIDCELAPKLHILKVASEGLKVGVTFEEDLLKDCPNLVAYCKFIFEDEAFLSGKDYDDATVIWGWKCARGEVGIAAA